MRNSNEVIAFSRKSSFHIFILFFLTFSAMTFMQNVSALISADTVNVRVANSITGNSLPDLSVSVYERLANGNEQWRANGYTNSGGITSFELEGIAGGRIYFLKTNPYNNGYAYSQDINSPGNITFNVGTLQVKVTDSISNIAFTNTKVFLYKRQPDGKSKYAGSGLTDTDGVVRFTPVGLEDGQAYFVKIKPYNTGYAYSQDIAIPSEITLNVGTLNVTVRDFINSAPLADTKVHLYKRQPDEKIEWIASGHTDTDGVIRFTPFGLEDGQVYFVRTKPYGTGYATSKDITTPGETTFNVGTLNVTLADFASNAPLANTKVTLYRRQSDGKSKGVASGSTDTNGVVRFTPFGLEDGQAYFVKTKPYNGGYAYSKDIVIPGETTLNVGTLSVTVTDFTSSAPITDTYVHLYRRQSDGKEKWAASGRTDTNGVIRFTPFGLEDGQAYFVKTKPYNAGYAYSKDITIPSETTLNVGTLNVTVTDFTNGTVLADTKVSLYARQSDGTSKWGARGRTDTNGVIRFTPFGLEDGKVYYVGTKPYDASPAYSQDVITPSEITLNVGTLNVTVIDFTSNTPLADAKVYLYKRKSDGKEKWAGSGRTDTNGVARFTPFGLENGQTYFVKAKTDSTTGYAHSKDYSAPSNFALNIGTLQVKVFDFIEQATLADTKVQLYERLADGSNKWRAQGNTDQNGMIRFTPFGLGEGQTYFVRTKPYDTGYAHREDITSVGEITFTVGTLQIKLLNYIDNTPVVDTRVDLYERLTDGTTEWRAKGNTNESGIIRFSPFGLGNGHTYFVAGKPYNAGNVYSEDITEARDLTYFINSNPVTLINGDNNQVLVNHKINAYQKLATGKLKWFKQGRTDDVGIVHFDLTFTEGEIYVFRAQNLFGKNKKYYSQLVSERGAVDFIVTADGDNSLDITPPEINFGSPSDGGNVATQGFQVSGLATDNKNVDKVILSVNDPTIGNTQLTASYNAVSNTWSANVTDSMVTLGNNITLTATAFDLAQNQKAVSITVTVMNDTEAPEIIITSHNNNDQVAVTGLLLSGTVIDQSQIVSFKASASTTLSGSSSSETLFSDRDIDFSQNGNWTLVLNNGVLTVGATVDITLNATDSLGNTSSESIQLAVVAVDTSELQMINRITFGATPALLQEVETLGATSFLNQQLSPNSIDDSVFEAMIASNMPTSRAELQAWTLTHMLYSKRQLREVMTWFWDNHFNTNINVTRTNAEGLEISNTVQYELNENIAFRANALGSFRTLLGISAKSPSMLIYLDSISNVRNDSNENYAREVMELFTMGVNSGYADEDVEAAAEIFTGWHVHSQGGGFVFHTADHTIGSYTLFENTGSAGVDESVFIPEGGESQGDLLLNALAEHRATAEYICSKLITLFVSDTPPATVSSQCVTEFQNSSAADDQMTRVLSVILQSAEFNFPENYRSKIKTPVEFVVGAVRNLEGESSASDLINPIRAMGIRLYENPVPTGWSEIGADWINSSLLMERMKWVNNFVRTPSNSTQTSSDPLVFYPKYGFETAEGIVGFLLQLSVGDDYTELSRTNALDILGTSFDFTNSSTDEQLRQLNGNVMSYPQYQFQ